MKFPFVFRSYHEQEVRRLTGQIVSLARLLYPEGVPEEFQLLLGIEVPKGSTTCAPQPAAPEPEPEPSESQKAEDEWKAEQLDDRSLLNSLARTRPSLVGPAMERQMARKIIASTRSVRPSETIFRAARSEALKQ